MRVHYYSSDWDGRRNLGDWLTVPLMRALGHEPELTDEPDRPILFGVGSIMNHGCYVRAPRIAVWGSGLMSRRDAEHRDGRLDVRAVRGPMTREHMGLPSSTPLGDPALLVPSLLALPEPTVRGETLYVGHCGSRQVTPDGFDAGLSMNVPESEALDLVSRIGAAGFVASESLHGCILAAAFGVPWAPCSVDPDRVMSDKWIGWLGYLGLDPTRFQPAVPANAEAWWERTGRHGKLRDLRPVIDAFPHDIES